MKRISKRELSQEGEKRLREGAHLVYTSERKLSSLVMQLKDMCICMIRAEKIEYVSCTYVCIIHNVNISMLLHKELISN